MGEPMPQRSARPELTAGEKTLVVLEEALNAARFSDIVSTTGLAKATVHRILATLIDRGFVVLSDEMEYIPGPKFLSIAAQAFDRVDVSAAVEPIVRELAEKTHCTVHVGVRNGDEMIYLVRMDSDRPYQMPSRKGQSVGMHCSGMGKAVLSKLSDEGIVELISRAGMPRRTARTITTVAQMKREIQQARCDGFTHDREENVPGVICIAAPVNDYTRQWPYAVSISTLALEHTEEDLIAMAPDLISTAKAMSKLLGSA